MRVTCCGVLCCLAHRPHSVDELTKEVADLVMDGALSARIDSKAGVLVSRQADDRVEAFERAEAMGKAFIRDTRAVLLRLNLLKLGVYVPPLHSGGGFHDMDMDSPGGELGLGGGAGIGGGGGGGGGGDDMAD